MILYNSTYIFKALFFTLFIALFAIAAHAQDKIYKRNGAVIEAKVTSVGDLSAIYKRADNPDGPDYTILLKEVARIVYQNGKTDTFSAVGRYPNKKTAERVRAGKRGKYGKNIFSFTPAAYTADMNGGINDIGIGVTYERLIDQGGRLGVVLPVMMCFSSPRDYDSYSVSTSQTYHSFYIMPGIKFYPRRDRAKVRYSMGGSLFCAFGSEPMGVYDYAANLVYNPVTGTYNTADASGAHQYVIYGLMFTNSLNITAGDHIFIALDFTIGTPIGDNRYADQPGFNGGADPLVQMAFKIGYRY